MNTTIKRFMKRIIVSLILSVLILSASYPVIYAMENKMENVEQPAEAPKEDSANNIVENTATNEAKKTEDNAVTQENKIKNEETEELVTENITNDTTITKAPAKVKKQTYKGKMYIDDPKYDQSFTVPNSKSISVKGWAVSTDSQAILKVYMDDEFVKIIDHREKREDVDKSDVVSGYGGTSTTPKAGFKENLDISSLNAGSHTIKVEQLSRDGDILSSETTKITVKVGSFKGKMNIENPTNSQSYTLPNTSTVKVKGWAVSNDNQATLKIYIDNKSAKTIDKRTNRNDVNRSVSTSYGGTTATPKAGFETTVDVSKLSNGNHKIKVEEIARNGAIICKQEVTIKIAQVKYKGKINIESPTNNQSYTLPNTSTVKVKGWAVSNDNQATLKIYIDNKSAKTIDKRTNRNDVNRSVSTSYGGTTATPKAGFETTVDVSKLANGNHKIKVEEISRFGAVICKQEIIIKIAQVKYKGKMNIENPANNQSYTLPNTSTVKVKGWAVSNDNQATLKIYIDNKSAKTIDKRTNRNDVNRSVSTSYGGTTATPKAGFETTVDVSKLSNGNHKIKVEEISRFGAVICKQEVTIKIAQAKYKGKMNIESHPILTYDISKNKTMTVKGWAVSNDPNSYMIIRIDGVQTPCSVARKKRNDVDRAVSASYGGTTATPNAGFTITTNIAKFKEGMHTVEVCEVSRYHKVIASGTLQLKVATPTYTGIMNIETPTRNKRYRSGWIEVKGWALTQCNGDYLDVYLDGIFQATAAGGKQRNDVTTAHGAKYPNHTQGAGFISNINGTRLKDGTHTIRVVHYSKYGKKIQEQSVTFVISNMTSKGIDVSYWQGGKQGTVIDWNAVRNAGIDFAILRVGYMVDSVTTPVKDPDFERNYSECKKYGIAVGGYFYSYAINREHAITEANNCINMIRGKTFEMPIFIDIEDPKQTNAFANGSLNRDGLTVIADTFCSILNANGYQSGIYANKNFMENYLNMSALEKYNVWLAHYTTTTNYTGRYDLWQYTSDGSIAGIKGKVDLNWCYRRY